MRICVIIPIHKSNPSPFEIISFQQCFRILGKYAIIVIAPKGLDLAEYKKCVNNVEVKFVDPKWLSSVLQYNKFKLSIFFYKLFDEYEFLLTYELDAFVFKDELIAWCDQDYDYIGAPWFEGYEKPTESNKIIGVGNSGFSLRKISGMKKMIRSIVYQPLVGGNKLEYFLYALKYPFRRLLNEWGENYTLQKYYNKNEDYFISKIAPRRYSQLRIAPREVAMKFSFETNPHLLYKMNGNNLPMGCHAWWRYDLEFWRFHINKYGYNI